MRRSLLAPTFVALAALVLLTCESVTDQATNDRSTAGVAPAGLPSFGVTPAPPPGAFLNFTCAPAPPENVSSPPLDEVLVLLLGGIQEQILLAQQFGDPVLDEKDADDLLKRLAKILSQFQNFFEKAEGKCDKGQDGQAETAFEKGVDEAVKELLKLADKVARLLDQNKISSTGASGILAAVDAVISFLD